MEENVRNEMEAVKGMVLTWKNSYLRDAPPEGGGEFLAEDLLQEVETYVYPYIRRLVQCEYLNQGEAEDILRFCHSQVADLRTSLAG